MILFLFVLLFTSIKTILSGRHVNVRMLNSLVVGGSHSRDHSEDKQLRRDD